MKKKLLLCSDFASPTGFATVAENVAKHLRNKWEIDILAVNYQGDAHPLQKEFNLYPASLGGDVYGLGRIVQLLRSKQYDLIFFINDKIQRLVSLRHVALVVLQIVILCLLKDRFHSDFTEELNQRLVLRHGAVCSEQVQTTVFLIAF